MPPQLPIRSRKRETPEQRRDMKISIDMMHVLWFAGLRGAVAYALAKSFPDTFGHRDEFICCTMVIVLVMIIVMGGGTEMFLNHLDITMNVDEEKYMKEWYKKQELRGGNIFQFGKGGGSV